MTYLSVTRNHSVALASSAWTDDICLVGGEGYYRLLAAFDYKYADACLVLRREGETEQIIASELGGMMSYSTKLLMREGDIVALQWKSRYKHRNAISAVAELSLTRTND